MAAEDISVRARRDLLLRECDWTQLEDSPLSPEDKEAWADYRQLLRDLPETYPDAELVGDIDWPEQP